MNKKAIAILGAIFLLIVGTLGFLIYSKMSQNKSQTPPTSAMPNTPTLNQPSSNQNSNPSGTPGQNNQNTTENPNPSSQTASSQVYKLTDTEQVVSPALFFNGNGVTFFDTAGSLYQADFDQSSGKLQLTKLRNLDIVKKASLEKILWPRQGNNFIAQTKNSAGKPVWSFFDSSLGAYTDLPGQISSLDWMPAGDKIIYIWSNPEGVYDKISVADPDGKNYRAISDIWEKNSSLNVSPDGLNVVFYRQNNLEPINKISLTTPDAKIWRTLVGDGYNFGVLWSPDSQKFLFGKKDTTTQKFQLWVYDLLSGQIKNTGLFTVPEKAVWSKDGNIVYAAVPGENSAPAGGAELTKDSFYKINIGTFEKQEYLVKDQTVDGREMFLNSGEDKLFFKNAQDKGLYYLDLNK